MGLFDKLFRRSPSEDDDGEETVIALDVEARRPQLLRLEIALDTLAREMRSVQSVDNPGWRARVNEYSRLAGDSMVMRKGIPTREGVLDLVFEVRPVFTGPPPPGLEPLVPLQDEVLAAAEDLRQLRPGEQG
ncbi:MAG: hypothetical protein ACRYG2_36750 [Janthinobacterium lividum]